MPSRPASSFVRSAALAFGLSAGVFAPAASAQLVQGACRGGEYIGCAQAPVVFTHREGLPVEIDIDTGWQPPNAPVQVRFRTAVVGHTAVRMEGALAGAWPEPMQLSLHGNPQGGTLETDWGVQLSARIRLSLELRRPPRRLGGQRPVRSAD